MRNTLYIVWMNRLQLFIAAPATAPKPRTAAGKSARQPA
jgi:hypothetical protein